MRRIEQADEDIEHARVHRSILRMRYRRRPRGVQPFAECPVKHESVGPDFYHYRQPASTRCHSAFADK